MGSLNIRHFPLVKGPGLTSGGWHFLLSVPLLSVMDWCLSAIGAEQRGAFEILYDKNCLCFSSNLKTCSQSYFRPGETINVNGPTEVFMISQVRNLVFLSTLLLSHESEFTKYSSVPSKSFG